MDRQTRRLADWEIDEKMGRGGVGLNSQYVFLSHMLPDLR